MSAGDLASFVEEFDKRLSKKSKVYRELKLHRNQHSLVFSVKALVEETKKELDYREIKLTNQEWDKVEKFANEVRVACSQQVKKLKKEATPKKNVVFTGSTIVANQYGFTIVLYETKNPSPEVAKTMVIYDQVLRVWRDAIDVYTEKLVELVANP